MANTLSRTFNPYPYGDRGVYTNPYEKSPLATKTEKLPYGGGTYNPSGGAKIAPTPIFTGSQPSTDQAGVDLYAKYRDPKTGEVMSPEEYAVYLGSKVPKGSGSIPQYAGDAMTNPNQSAAELTKTATNLNNQRNDIATGTIDPYKVSNQSGIAYSPTELKAIENAYAGIYDPALNDVFARLEEKKKADERQAAREDIIFKTNESIRAWKETTGTKGSGGSGSGGDYFTRTQLNNGASNSGLTLEVFEQLDDDVKNFYINPPMALNDLEKKVPMYENFEEDFLAVTAGDLSADELSDDIMNSSLPPAVKHYFVGQIPEEGKKKEGWIKRIWGAITN